MQGFLRGLVADDARDAMTRERETIARAVAPAPLDTGLARGGAREGDTEATDIEIGEFIEHPGLRLLLPIRTPPVHALVVGGTGTGKTYLMRAVLRARMRAFALGGGSDRPFIVDPKDELDGMLEEDIATLLPTLPDAAAERLLSNLVRIDPFSTEALVPFNVLKPEPGTDPDAAAWSFTSLLARVSGAHLGVNQDGFAHAAHLLGQELAARPQGCTLLDLARLIDNPSEIRSLGLASANAAVRGYFAAPRLPASSLHGVRSRLHRLLRLGGARRMFGARECVSFASILRDRFTCVNVGSAPLGVRDLADFWLGLIMDRLVSAIFARTGSEEPVTLAVDEWQMVANAARWVAEDFERVLAVCRSRRVHLTLACQSLDAVRRVSSTLPHVALTNCDWRFIFRTDIDDARAVSHLVPVLGRRPRDPPRPWEGPSRDPFLTPAEERNALVERITRLRTREFLFADRTGGAAGAFVRAKVIAVPRRPRLPAVTSERIARGVLALPWEDALRAVAREPGPRAQLGLFERTPAPSMNRAPSGLPRRRGRLGG